MSLPYPATAQVQEPDVDQRILFDKPLGVHQRTAHGNTNRFEVMEAAMLEALWYASRGEEGLSASIGFAPARLDGVAFDKLPSGASAFRARSKLYVGRFGNHVTLFLLVLAINSERGVSGSNVADHNTSTSKKQSLTCVN
jgi:hypothetical protein